MRSYLARLSSCWLKLTGRGRPEAGSRSSSRAAALALLPLLGWPMGARTDSIQVGRETVMLPGADDGMVSVERTKVEGMSDFLAVPRTHTFMMRGQDVIAQTMAFLRHGEFRHEPGDRAGP